MNVAGYVLLILAFTTAHGAVNGRTVPELWGDLRDLSIALMSLDTKAVSEVFNRKGKGGTLSPTPDAVTVMPSHDGSANAAEQAAKTKGITGSANAAEYASANGMPRKGNDPRNDLIRLGRWLAGGGFEGKKVRVGEHPSFGGVAPVHVAGSYHYKGLALDLNYDKGREEKATFDRLSKALVGANWRVIWWAPKHYDHIHVDTGPAGFVRNPY